MSVNTNTLSKIYICATPQASDLDAAGFGALTWVEIKGIGNFGEIGTKTNILNYDTWGDTVTQKGKGMSDAGSPTLEMARQPTDPGQLAINAAAKTNFQYAIKKLVNDPATSGGVGTQIFNRGIITGPTRPQGKNEDFDLEVFTFGFNQLETKVDPT